MSIDVMSAVWRLPPDATRNATERFVLVCLADQANSDGVCWPSIQTVADRVGVSTSRVQQAVRSLREAGLLAVEVRTTGGRQTSNLYRVLVRDGAGSRGEGGAGSTLGVERATPSGVERATPEPKEGTITEPPEGTITPSPPPDGGGANLVLVSPPAAAPTASGFDAFWEVYPRKVGKGAARTAYTRARKKADQTTLLAGVARYVAAAPTTEWAHPTTWLNQERWLDEYGTEPPAKVDSKPSKSLQALDLAARMRAAEEAAEGQQSLGYSMKEIQP